MRPVFLSVSIVFTAVFFFVPARAELSIIGLSRAAVRPKPSVLAKPQGFLKYGDSVSVLGTQGRWSQVQAGALTGWLESSSLGHRKSILKEIGKSDAEISKDYQDEVASAAKGFSEEMEALHKKQNPELNYSAVDRVEKIEVDMDEVVRFSRQGKLKSRVLMQEMNTP